MTNGIVSIRVDGQMLYKIVVGHDGMHAHEVADCVRSFVDIPSVGTLKTICAHIGFGCPDCLIILERDPENWHHPKIHAGRDVDWDDENPEYQRYYDTFHVAEFNPRWKYGTAPYVEVIDIVRKDVPQTADAANQESSGYPVY